MARYLQEKGVRARTAWPPGRPRELDRPEVLVSLRGCRMGPGGFQDYLGERYNPDVLSHSCLQSTSQLKI